MNYLPTTSFKDFENIAGLDILQRAKEFDGYLNHLAEGGRLNYRLESSSPCGPEMELMLPGERRPKPCICLVSNDYLGLTQHLEVKTAVMLAIARFGTGAGASPAIGGHYSFHQQLEDKVGAFFKRKEAIIYTTGYTANSATLQCLMKKEDIAILDMAVHASVYEGCQLTNVKTFLHNNLEMLERILKNAQHRYRTKMVVVDGVYSQDGDLAPLDKISDLCRQYGAYLCVDDAHGLGVVGNTGRGVIELYDLYDKVDLITGTFSKALAGTGGFVIANPELIRFLKFQAKQHLFSTTASPATMGILRALELIDEEPWLRQRLWENINYLKKGLQSLGLNIGDTASAIVPVKIGDIVKTLEAGRLLLRAGVYTNPIMYPAVAKKDARIRLNITASHTKNQLDKVLNAFEDLNPYLIAQN